MYFALGKDRNHVNTPSGTPKIASLPRNQALVRRSWASMIQPRWCRLWVSAREYEFSTIRGFNSSGEGSMAVIQTWNADDMGFYHEEGSLCKKEVWRGVLLYRLCLLQVFVDLFKSPLDSGLFYELSYHLTWVFSDLWFPIVLLNWTIQMWKPRAAVLNPRWRNDRGFWVIYTIWSIDFVENSVLS